MPIPDPGRLRPPARGVGRLGMRPPRPQTSAAFELGQHKIDSHDIEPMQRRAVTADLTVAGRPGAMLERIVMTLGVEPGVVAVSWRAAPRSDEERALIADGCVPAEAA